MPCVMLEDQTTAPLCGDVEMHRKKVKDVLETCETWEKFDVFRLEEVTRGRPLQSLVRHVLQLKGLIERLRLDVARLELFLERLEDLYSRHVSYHHKVHATDVVQAVVAMMACDAWGGEMEDWEMLSLILAAAAHDVGHQGLSNEFHWKVDTEWARKYGENTQSVNEYGHVCITMGLMGQPECDFLVNVDANLRLKIEKLIEYLIMKTDMGSHGVLCDGIENTVDVKGSSLAGWVPEDREDALAAVLHFADISNPGRPWKLCSIWGSKVQEEQFVQGDHERELGFAVSDSCDRGRSTISKSQIHFIEEVLKPCCSQISLLAPNFVNIIMPNVETSLEKWKAMGAPIGGT